MMHDRKKCSKSYYLVKFDHYFSCSIVCVRVQYFSNPPFTSMVDVILLHITRDGLCEGCLYRGITVVATTLANATGCLF